MFPGGGSLSLLQRKLSCSVQPLSYQQAFEWSKSFRPANQCGKATCSYNIVGEKQSKCLLSTSRLVTPTSVDSHNFRGPCVLFGAVLRSKFKAARSKYSYNAKLKTARSNNEPSHLNAFTGACVRDTRLPFCNWSSWLMHGFLHGHLF